MAFKRKGAPSARSLNDPEGVAMASQKGAGNSGYDINDECYSSGLSPVNSQGQVTDKMGKQMGWPFTNFTEDHLLNPDDNPLVPATLSEHKSTSGKDVSISRGSTHPSNPGLL